MSRKTPTAAARRRAKRLASPEDLADLLPYTHPLSWYRPGRRIIDSDRMQGRYAYTLSARPGRDFAPGFRCKLHYKDMRIIMAAGQA